MRRQFVNLILIISTILLFSLISSHVHAQIISKNFLYGQINQDIKLAHINSNEQYLFVPTEEGMYLVENSTFEVVKFIQIDGHISHYEIIDNIEDESKPNKDLMVFIDDDTMQSVIIYSLDSLDVIWSYTTFTNGFNDQSIKIEKKTPVFDYDFNDNNLLLVSGYKLYNIDIKTGHLVWDYEYTDNIWSVAFIGDINSDLISDVAISVQPSSVIALDGKNGDTIWENKYAKAYDVKKDDKVLGSVKRNIWDITYVNSNLILTGEDAYIYQVNPTNGTIINEKNILDSIPNILAYQIYLDGSNVKDFSGLQSGGNSAYQIIRTRKVMDCNGDNKNDLLVTAYEPNKYANYNGMTPSLYLIDGQTFDVIWQMDLNSKQLIDLNINSNGDLSFFDGKNIDVFNIKDNTDIKEIKIDSNSNNNEQSTSSFYPLVVDNNLIINNNGLFKLDISDPSNPTTISSITNYNGYDTVIEGNRLYKLYFNYSKDNQMIKNYKTIACFSDTNELLYSYNLNDNGSDGYFNKYIINQDSFIFVNNLNELYTLDYGSDLEVQNYNLNILEDSSSNKQNNEVVVLSLAPDFNSDGQNDLLINYQNGDVLILDSTNYNHAIINDNLYNLFPGYNPSINCLFPLFILGEKEMYALSNNKILIVSFDDNNIPTIKKEISLDPYNFWNNSQNIKYQYDYDNDGYKDYVISANIPGANSNSNEALILYTNEETVGSITTGWDSTIYPTNEDLNNDGHNEVIVTTNRTDSDGNGQNVSEIVNPYTPINQDDVLFTKIFYDGNNITYNTQYKALTIVDDITGDGKKDVLVLIDRWGDSYIQVYSIDDDQTIEKIIPVSINYTNIEDMQNNKIGAPGGYIDTFNQSNTNYMIMSVPNQNQDTYTTRIVEFDGFNLSGIASINARIHDYQIINNTFYYQQVMKKNEENYTIHSFELDQKLTITNEGLDKTYKNSQIKLNWELDSNIAYYNIYIDGKLVEITPNDNVNLFLQNGINKIGIGGVSKNGVETITTINLNVNTPHANASHFIIYTVLILILVSVLPLKIKKYKRREPKDV